MADVWIKSVRTPEALTDTEIRMVESHLVSVMLQWDHMLQMDANGLITRANTQSHISSSAPFYFGSRFGKNWWKYEKDGWKGTRMWEIAGPIIRGLDENFIANRLDRTRIAPAPAPAAPRSIKRTPSCTRRVISCSHRGGAGCGSEPRARASVIVRDRSGAQVRPR